MKYEHLSVQCALIKQSMRRPAVGDLKLIQNARSSVRSVCVHACVHACTRVWRDPSFNLMMTFTLTSKSMCRSILTGLVTNWLLSVFQAVRCRWQMLSSSWVRSERLSTKPRPRRCNWAGSHSCGRRATRGSSPFTKASRHSTFASSTACWSLEAWTGSYACGTPSFLGEKKRIWWDLWNMQIYLKKKKKSSSPLISLFRKPTGILKGHSAPIAYLSISSEDSQIFSVSTDGTAKVIHGSSLGWMDGWTDDGWALRRPIFHFSNAFASHVALALNPLCIISCFRPIPGRSYPLSSCMLTQFSLQPFFFFFGNCPPEMNLRCKGTRLTLNFEWFCPCQGNDGWPWVTQQLFPDKNPAAP